MCARYLSEVVGVLGILRYDMLIVPIWDGSHWTCGVVDLVNERFEVYDSNTSSQASRNCDVFANTLTRFLKKYAAFIGSVTSASIPFHTWERTFNTGPDGEQMPVQTDGSSCGVFMLAVMEFRARDKPVRFTARQVPMFRRSIAYMLCE